MEAVMKKVVAVALLVLGLGVGSVCAAESADMSRPTVLEKVAPAYPDACMDAGIEGRVIVECLVTRNGTVVGATALRSPDPALGEAAVAAVSSWKFSPAMRDGKAVDAVIRIPVEFTLEKVEGASVPRVLASR
jgi:protein TonB